MKNTNQIINEWRDAVHLAAEAPSKEEKELITTLPWTISAESSSKHSTQRTTEAIAVASIAAMRTCANI